MVRFVCLSIMATEISKECPPYSDTNASLEKNTILTILYGREYNIRLSSDLAICSISDRPQKAAESIDYGIKLSIIKDDFFLDLSDLQNFFSLLAIEDCIAYGIPVRIDSMESLQFQMSVISENYESLLNTNFPLSLKYLCRDKILDIICIRSKPLINKIDSYSLDCYFNKLLQNQCYWKQLPLPVSVKLYLNGCLPIFTYAMLLIPRVISPVVEFPYNLRVLPPVKIVRIKGGQGGYVSLNKNYPKSAKIEDFIIFPSHAITTSSSIYWIMITIAPNHFIFESTYHPNRYIFAPDPTGKTYSRKSTLFLSRPFYAGPENVFSLVEGGTPYWIHEIYTIYGIKSVKWSTNSEGMFWRWQNDHYHQASKIGDRYAGDECYCIKPVISNFLV